MASHFNLILDIIPARGYVYHTLAYKNNAWKITFQIKPLDDQTSISPSLFMTIDGKFTYLIEEIKV